MKSELIKRIRTSYYENEFKKTDETIDSIMAITTEFKNGGSQRLLGALCIKNYDLDEIARLDQFLCEARQKMENEYRVALKKTQSYNSEYATNTNGYYGIVGKAFSHFNSHMVALRDLFIKFRSTKHPNQRDCEIYKIEPHELIASSALGQAAIEYPMFPIDDQADEIQDLYKDLVGFFNTLDKGLALCKKMNEEEERIARSRFESYAILRKCKNDAHKRLKNQVLLITRDVIETLKVTTPSYLQRMNYASEEDFAPCGFHKHNIADMDHYVLITDYEEMEKFGFTQQETVLWTDIKTRSIVRSAAHNFDRLLPNKFDADRMMGKYMYYFCRWSKPDNIKAAWEYFTQTYQGDYKVVAYNSVQHHSKNFDENAVDWKYFLKSIEELPYGDVISDNNINNSQILLSIKEI